MSSMKNNKLKCNINYIAIHLKLNKIVILGTLE